MEGKIDVGAKVNFDLLQPFLDQVAKDGRQLTKEEYEAKQGIVKSTAYDVSVAPKCLEEARTRLSEAQSDLTVAASHCCLASHWLVKEKLVSP